MRRKLEQAMEKLYRQGPDRVMISEVEATDSRRARIEYGIVPSIIFVRNDGWMLGAPREYESAAYEMWKDQWIGYRRRWSEAVVTIDHYQQSRQ